MVRRKKYGPFDYERRAGQRNYDVQSDIDRIIINSEARMLAVVRQSISEMVEDMQTPTAKGGKMRVDTGFLRSSGLGSLEGPPSGPVRGDKDKTYTWNGDFINTTLLKMKLGDSFYFGWTAHYAKYREAYDGFLEAGLQKWQNYVDKAVTHFRNKDMRK